MVQSFEQAAKQLKLSGLSGSLVVALIWVLATCWPAASTATATDDPGHAISRPTSTPGQRSDVSPNVVPSDSLPPEILATIKHRTRGIRPEEFQAYYRALGLARDLDYQSQKAAAQRLQEARRSVLCGKNRSTRPFPAFVDLFQHPEIYHGRSVTLTGHIRLLRRLPADENDADVHELFEAWLYTEDSQSNPAVVVTTSIPKGIPLGNTLNERVSVTGFFFKMYGYSARDTSRVAPLILARQLEWYPRPSASERRAAPMWAYFLVTGLAVLIIVGIWRTIGRRRRIRATQLSSDRDPESPDFQILETPSESGQHGTSDGH